MKEAFKQISDFVERFEPWLEAIMGVAPTLLINLSKPSALTQNSKR
jgi:hypothetical protein